MAQVTDIQVANQPRSTFRASMNAVFEAIVSDFSGASAPSNPRAFMKWKDTSTTPATYKERNAANNAWITIGLADTNNWGLATVASPTFTGTPSAPTAAVGTSTTQLATTAFVESQVSLTWINMTLQNSFVADGSPTFETPQYTKSRGFVYCRGKASRSASGLVSGTVVANLPAGYRPLANIDFPLDSGGNPGAIVSVRTDGNILYVYVGTPGYSGVVYPTFSFSFSLS